MSNAVPARSKYCRCRPIQFRGVCSVQTGTHRDYRKIHYYTNQLYHMTESLTPKDENDNENGTDDEMLTESPQHEPCNDITSTTTATTITNHADLQNVLESIARITLAGFGGSIVGLSLQKRLESMRVRTAAGLSAAARRKRAPVPMNKSLPVNLPIRWGVSCMIFCSIIEASRLTSPSTMVLRNMGWYTLEHNYNDDCNDTENNNNNNITNASIVAEYRTGPASSFITVADYAIGGLVAGLAGSVGQNFHLQQSAMSFSTTRRVLSPGRYFGVGPGLGLGLMAGCLQAAIDYGISLAEQQSQREDRQQQQPQQQ
jgi:hypothetical protein